MYSKEAVLETQQNRGRNNNNNNNPSQLKILLTRNMSYVGKEGKEF
jgi:hypothetical protein